MPEIEPYLADDGVTRVSPPSPRTALFWDGTHWHVPRVDDEGRVQVRGEDQLFSIDSVVAQLSDGAVSGAGGYRESAPVPAGYYWIITNIVAQDATTPTTEHIHSVVHDGVVVDIYRQTEAFAAWVSSVYQGHAYLDAGDVVRVIFAGSLAGDICRVMINGYQMTLET